MAKKILVVDDEPSVLRLLGYTLQGEGYEVVTSESGLEAIDIALRERPDLVLLDIMMPDMDGFEVCRRLRATPHLADLPIIMITAKTQTEDKVAGFQVGADDYITKPVEPLEMLARIRAVLARSKGVREVVPTHRARIIGFQGVKGGVGTTTLAVNIASVLTSPGNKVILADLHPYTGAVCLQLGITPRHTTADLARYKPENITARVIETYLVPHSTGLNILPAPQKSTGVDSELTASQMESILSQLERLGDYLVLDIPVGFNRTIQTALSVCDSIVLITEPEAIALAMTKATISRFVSIGILPDSVKIVMINRVGGAPVFTAHEVLSSTGVELLGTITPAPEVYLRAIRMNTPLVLSQPDSFTAELIKGMAKQIA